MRKMFCCLAPILLLAVAMAGCGGGDPGTTPTGTAQISLTDAPGADFDNVLITVRAVWFHTSDASGPDDAGWLKIPLATPRTVDLARLTDGTTFPVFDGITLPVGHYQQILVFLAPTEDNAFLQPYNNEVIDNNVACPLRVPDAAHGIRLAGSFRITDGGTLRIAIDFDIGHDVVRVMRGGATEYILKPRLRYFDLDNVGSVTGRIDAATRSAGYNFVFKAERPNSDYTFYQVHRFTTVRPDNAFVLSFLAPGTYDIVMRGRGVETVIVRGVPVTRGNATDLGPAISMPPGTEFAANVSVHPTGSWVNFYQTLDNAVTGVPEIPYEIRYRHVNPFTGSFFDDIALSNGPIHLRAYTAAGGGSTSPVASISPKEWNGGNAGFGAVAQAVLYDRSPFTPVDNAMTSPISFGSLTVMAPAVPRSTSGLVTVPNMRTMGDPGGLENGFLVAVHGGMIVDKTDMTPGMMGMGNNEYSFDNLPGGSLAFQLPGSYYNIEAIGWTSTSFAIGVSPVADLRTGDSTGTNFPMFRIF